MRYVVNGNEYEVSYTELRTLYNEFCNMSDVEFREKILDALHLACIIAYFKNIPTQYILSDEGIIHDLVHLMQDENVRTIQEIREEFKETLKLV